MDRLTALSLTEAFELCRGAALAAGAREQVAEALARAAIAAEAEGNTAVGIGHFTDYLDALRAGRIDGHALPVLSKPAPAIILCDAMGGTAHLGFDMAFGDVVAAARSSGVAIFSQRNAYTCGALGYFAARLSDTGLVALAAANGPALMAPPGVKKPVYCTNPIAFAAPQADRGPLVIDQSSSQTAFVKIRQAAEAGVTIPAGWAIDEVGEPTCDPAAAMRGALITFGGTRGANIALMAEVLSAGLSGANWSADAPSFRQGSACPGVGLFVLAIEAALFGADFAVRMQAQLDRLAAHGVHIPGSGRDAARAESEREGITLSTELHRRIAAFGKSP
jgi:(2R)-3-sulfolactate dehydrogenase (NADP+)